MCITIGGCAKAPSEHNTGAAAGRQTAEERLGIKISGLRLSAAGYMVDLRYRVLEPEKASPIFDRKTKPYLVDEATGARFAVPSPPEVGQLRTTSNPPETGRQYYVLFANPGRYIKPGRKATIVVGEYRLEHLVVE